MLDMGAWRAPILGGSRSVVAGGVLYNYQMAVGRRAGISFGSVQQGRGARFLAGGPDGGSLSTDGGRTRGCMQLGSQAGADIAQDAERSPSVPMNFAVRATGG